jgi:hypothetical protein
MGTASRRTSNLTRARKIKSRINSEFAALSDGRITLRDVLESPEDYEMRRCDVYDVLRRAPKLGKIGAKKILLNCKIWPHDKLNVLDPMQLEDILSHLPPRAR